MAIKGNPPVNSGGYPEGKECSRCGEWKPLPEFYRDSANKTYGRQSKCKTCHDGYSRSWRERNPERARYTERVNQWRRENKERYHSHAKNWTKSNPGKVKSIHREYKEANREKVQTWSANNCGKRRARKRNATPSWANGFFISEAYDLARLRTKQTGIKWHVDHIVPLKSELVCGLHVEHNLQVIPAVENIRKCNYYWPDMP